MRRPSVEALLVPALLLLNLVLKLTWLGVNELAGDEPFTVHWSQQRWPVMLEMLREENNPPLYFLLIKVWSWIVPFEPAWLRMPSAVFSALSVWPLFLLTRKLVGPFTALTAGLLFTFSNYHFGFAHEVRAYSLFTLLSTTGLWLLWRAQDRTDIRLRDLLALITVNVLMVYTHFFGWLAIGVQALCVLAMPELRGLRKAFFQALGITLAAFAPYLFIFFGRASSSIAHGTWLQAPVPEEIYNMLWRWSNAPVPTVIFLLVIVGMGFHNKWRSPAIRMGLLCSIVPLVCMFLVSFKVPMFLDRYLVYAAPGFAMLVAACAERMIHVRTNYKPGLRIAAVLCMLISFAPWKENGQRPSAAMAQWRAWGGTNAITWCIPHWYDLTLAASSEMESLKGEPAYPSNMLARVNIFPIEGAPGPGDMPKSQDSLLLVIDAGSQFVDPDRRMHGLLQERFSLVDSVEAYHQVWMYRFRRMVE